MHFSQHFFDDSKSHEFFQLAENLWPEYFNQEVTPLLHTQQKWAWCILGIENEKVVAGAILSEKNINILSGKAGEYTQNLERDGYLNFSYFIVEETQRKTGVGSKLIKYIQSKYSKIWFDSRPHNFDFYEKRGAVKKIAEDGNSGGFVFVFE